MVATYGAPFSCVSQTQASNFLRKFSTWATKPSARHLRGYQPWLSFPAPLGPVWKVYLSLMKVCAASLMRDV